MADGRVSLKSAWNRRVLGDEASQAMYGSNRQVVEMKPHKPYMDHSQVSLSFCSFHWLSTSSSVAECTNVSVSMYAFAHGTIGFILVFYTSTMLKFASTAQETWLCFYDFSTFLSSNVGEEIPSRVIRSHLIFCSQISTL